MFALGLIVIIVSVLQLRKRYRQESERQKNQLAAISAAQEEERRRQKQKGEEQRQKPGTPELNRVPIAPPPQDKFTGTIPQGQIAKWEAEIFTIGRQIIGQIDSKMVAIETLTLEATRAANRLELLIEHFEQLTENINSKKNNDQKKSHRNTIETNHKPESQNQQQLNNTETLVSNEKTAPENTEQKPEKFIDYLSELETEINDFQDKIDEFGKAKDVTILKAVDNIHQFDDSQLAKKQSENSNSINSQKNVNLPHLSSPRFPGNNIDNEKSNSTNTKEAKQEQNRTVGLPIESLFNESADNTNIPQKKQIEMLANYGYNTKQIAQNMNMTIGEVEMILSLKK
jgi:hypothetical protein